MNKQTKARLAAAGIAVVVVIAVVAAALLGSAGSNSEKGVLTRYYKAMYCEDGGGMDTIVQCLYPAMQQEYYDTVTLGGTNFSQLSAWRMEAMQLVGDNIQVDLTITADLPESSSDLQAIKQSIPGAQRYRVVSFRLELTGSQGTEQFLGVMALVQVDGTWYMGSADAGLKRVIPESTDP